MKPIIKATAISKQFRLGAREAAYATFRESLVGAMQAPFNRAASNGSSNHFWALRDVSFDVMPGEVVGIIGRNGAGKSTLLKVLSRITEPTKGRIELYGRVASLLEVGTGFHPELSGRENIFLNGIILGMKRSEIERKFDEIVAFAEVEKFIDTPVKRYSSGMYLRLAFAVAAHLEPEILVVDEVLAVGDAQFQKKCLGKMSEVSRQGRTVLFVSHNLGAVTRLCGRALWLVGGQLKSDGPAAEVVAAYMAAETEITAEWTPAADASDAGDLQIERVRILDNEGEPSASVPFGQPFDIEISYRLRHAIPNLSIVMNIADAQGNVVLTSWDTDTTQWKDGVREAQNYSSTCHFPAAMLRPGRYWLSFGGRVPSIGGRFHFNESAFSFDVSPTDYPFNTKRPGIITPILPWDIVATEERN